MSKETPPPGAVALVHAAKEGLADEAERLLATHPSLIAYRGQGTPDAIVGNTPAHWAAARGHAVVLGALLRAGADTHARNNKALTSVHCPSRGGHTRPRSAQCATSTPETRHVHRDT